jgi:hypothetical protein
VKPSGSRNQHSQWFGPPLVIRIADRPVVVFDLKAVKLENQRIVRDQSLIFRPTVRAPTAEETLVPPATRFDVGHRDEWLGPHQNLRRNSARAILRRGTTQLSSRLTQEDA